MLEIVDDDSDSLQQTKPRRQRKSTAGERKIHHKWTDDEIICLVSSVEKRRGLWDSSSAEYKLTKLDGWQSVADELGFDGVDGKEAKIKWSSLRTTYMINLKKLRKKKSRQGTNGPHTVTWKFFNSLMFLESNNIIHSSSSTSTLNLESDDINCSLLTEFMAPSLQSESTVCNERKRSQSESTVCNLGKRSRSVTSVRSPSSSSSADSFSSRQISFLNTSVAALHSTDTNSAFCDHLLAELRTLSDSRSRELRYKISRLMMDFIETIQEQTPISPRPNLIQSGRDAERLLSSDMGIKSEEIFLN